MFEPENTHVCESHVGRSPENLDTAHVTPTLLLRNSADSLTSGSRLVEVFKPIRVVCVFLLKPSAGVLPQPGDCGWFFRHAEYSAKIPCLSV